MAQPRLLTFRDSIEYARDVLGANAPGTERTIREAIETAYEEIADAHNWGWLKRHGRIPVQAADSDGTVTYDHTGNGSGYERYVTLAGTTFPDDSADYYIEIDDLQCAIELWIDSTHCTLDVTLNPGADVAAGTACTIYPAYYILPADFLSLAGPWGEDDWNLAQYVRPDEWLALNRYPSGTGPIDRYTIMAPPDLYGSQALFIDPAADADETVDMIYKRMPRDLKLSGYATADSAGTIAASAGSPTVTGTGTSFSSDMVNAVLRVGTDATNIPTRLHGIYPFAGEYTIKSVTNTTTLTLHSNATAAASGVKYVVSDPVDIDRTAYRAFLALTVAHLGAIRNVKNKAELFQIYERELAGAKGGNNRVTQRRVAGGPRPFLSRLADNPNYSDLE